MSWEFFLSVLFIYIILRPFFIRGRQLDIEIVRKQTEIRNIKIEVINETIYLWDASSEDFLAQGKTLEDAIDVLKIRFPDVKFAMNRPEYDKSIL